MSGRSRVKDRRAVKRVHDGVEKAMSEGDYDRLEKLLNEIDTVRDTRAAIISMRDLALKSYSEVVDGLVKASPRTGDNPMLWIQVIHDIFIRAMIADFEQYLKVSRTFQLAHYFSSIKEAVVGAGESPVSFSNADARPAKELYTTLYENYKKLSVHFSRLARIADAEAADRLRSWKKPFPDQGGRYVCLRPSEADTFIRNAISHKTFRRLETGTYELTDRDGGSKREYSAAFLDKRLQSLWLRLHSTNVAMLIPGILTNQMLLLAIDLDNARRRKRRAHDRRSRTH